MEFRSELKARKILSVAVSLILIITMVFASTTSSFAAAKVPTKTVTRNFYPIENRTGIKALDVYGKDAIKITYNTSKKTIVSCTVSQTAKNVAKCNIVEKGGTSIKKNSSKKYTVTTTWYINFRILPPAIQKVAKKMTPYLSAISDMGRFLKATCIYEVYGDGTAKYLGNKLTWQVPSNLKSSAIKLASLFMK